MPDFLMIEPQVSISDFRKTRSGSGDAAEGDTGTAPRSAIRELKAWSWTAICKALSSLSSAGFGVPLGAHMPYQITTSNPFMPCSSNVGNCGSDGTRAFEVTP